MATETSLHDSVANSQVLPPGFTVCRKDRNEHGDGACLLILSDSSISELSFPDNNIQSVWGRVPLPKGTTLVLVDFIAPKTLTRVR